MDDDDSVDDSDLPSVTLSRGEAALLLDALDLRSWWVQQFPRGASALFDDPVSGGSLEPDAEAVKALRKRVAEAFRLAHPDPVGR